MKKIIFSLVFFVVLMLNGCVPSFLEKYQKNDLSDNPSERSPGRRDKPGTNLPSKQRTNTPAIYPVDKNTFRFVINEKFVWDSALNVLIKNYNLNLVDKGSGIITTEWDSYSLKNQTYRNKITILVKKINWDLVEVMVFNNIEELRGINESGGLGVVWLPAPENSKETNRIIKNMAIYLNQPAPVLIDGKYADSSDKSETPQ